MLLNPPSPSLPLYSCIPLPSPPRNSPIPLSLPQSLPASTPTLSHAGRWWPDHQHTLAATSDCAGSLTAMTGSAKAWDTSRIQTLPPGPCQQSWQNVHFASGGFHLDWTVCLPRIQLDIQTTGEFSTCRSSIHGFDSLQMVVDTRLQI